MKINKKIGIIGIVVITLLMLTFISNKQISTTDSKELEEIVLIPEKDENDFDHDFEIIEQRAKLLSNTCDVKKEGDHIVLKMDITDIGRDNLNSFIECLLCEPMEHYFSTELDLSFGYIAPLNKEDIISYSTVEREEGKELHIQFTDSINKILEDSNSESLVIMQTNDNNQYLTNKYTMTGFLIHKGEDDYYMNFEKSDALYNQEDSLMYSLMNDYLSTPYNYYFQGEIEWQKIEDLNSSEIGLNQVNELEDDDIYTLTFRHQGERYTYDELDEVLKNTKSKLDCLDTPYVYGVNKYGDICIKLSASRVGEETLSLIESYPNFKLRCSQRSVSISNSILEVDEDNQCIDVYLDKDALKELNSIVSKSNDNKIYLLMDSMPIMYFENKEGNNLSKLHFDTFCYKEDNSGDIWFIQYIKELFNYPLNTTGYYYLSNIVYGENGYGDQSHYGIQESYLLDYTDLKNELLDTYSFIDIETKNNGILINFTKEMQPNKIVESMESICRTINERKDFSCAIWFSMGEHENILISCDDYYADINMYLNDIHKKDFNESLMNEIEKNDYFSSLLKEKTVLNKND